MLKQTRIIFVLLLTLIITFNGYGQKLTEEEQKLYNIVMNHRKEKGLPPIPLSKSLTYVAQIHAKDLMINRPTCNGHSWSNKGRWKPCCFSFANAECSWSKPRELTTYNGSGFEITASISPGWSITAQQCFDGWLSSPDHYSLIISRYEWGTRPWKAIGIGIYKEYGCIWFGYEEDK